MTVQQLRAIERGQVVPLRQLCTRRLKRTLGEDVSRERMRATELRLCGEHLAAAHVENAIDRLEGARKELDHGDV